MIDHASQPETLKPKDFDSEKQLEEVVCRFPELLMREGDARLSFVSQQIQMSSGIMDAVMIDSDGLPVAVEVKLGRNAQARREIVGQLVDYVSTMTEYTVDEFDDLVGGKVLDAIDMIAKDDETERKKIWQTLGANLRAGLARYILVLDEVPSELGRIVRFLAMRSNLDIRLVEISKYVSASGQVFYTPLNLVEQGDSGTEKISSAGGAKKQLQEVIDAYALTPGVHPLRGQAINYRQILPPTWPSWVHYEFVYRAKSILVDIHLEGAKARDLAPLLKSWESKPPPGFPYPLEWDPKWCGYGRVTARLPANSTPAEIARAMVDLIAATETQISQKL